ncbi:glycosyltransferase [Mesorhizobium abyssinicae]|uniref:glycosyltransferase n=2 Tax=Mesorhizobium abyssinicae TaxID=1209958 RepID=UPI00339971A6
MEMSEVPLSMAAASANGIAHVTGGDPAKVLAVAENLQPEVASSIFELVEAGRAYEALAYLDRQEGALQSPELRRLRGDLVRALQVLEAHRRPAHGESTSLAALDCILDAQSARRVPPPPTKRLTGVALMTGHLGAGGAELQMARTAEMLAGAAGSQQKIAGVKLSRPFHVVVNSLTPNTNRPLNFFGPVLARKNIPVWALEDLPPAGLEDSLISDETTRALLPLLYPNIRKGLRLVSWFQQQKIQVAYIWQDNAILHFAVAALLAGVPRLVLNFRGMPPVLRWKEHLPEFEKLYTALAAMPGVTFVCNSSKAASAYSDWIGCSRDAFHVISNGSDLHSAHPTARELKTWSEFDARTRDATITIGGIFRMHPNKRPLEWVQFARYYLNSHPKARFVLIGSGVFFETVRDLVRTLGLTRRLLLVQQTKAGTYWLKKMDVFLLLSRYEGTPNVLIEAQLAGVPVVCTPVANATDTFVDGVTGLATSVAIDVEDIAAKVDQIATHARLGDAVPHYARRHISARYSARSMIEHTVRVLSGQRDEWRISVG